MKLSSLSIVIPAYNDEKTIESVVERAILSGKKCTKRYELICINDASADATGSILDDLQKQIKELRVVHHRTNKGYGETIKELYYESQYDWLFSVPGDFQIDPMEIVKLIPYHISADMIIGDRVNRQENAKRLRQSRIYNHLIRMLFHVPIYDINSVRLMRTNMLKTIQLKSTSAFVDAELTISAIRKGFRVAEIPIIHKKRDTAGAGGGKLSIILPTIWDMVVYFFSHAHL